MIVTTEMIEILDQLDPHLRTLLIKFLKNLEQSLGEVVKREDFIDLKKTVEELAQAQKRTEEKVEELAEAQKRTEQTVEELAEAQKRTEERVEELAQAQKRTEDRLSRLEKVMEELAEAQKRTEQRVEELAQAQKRTEDRLTRLEKVVEELAQAQKRTEETMQRGFKELRDQINALGSRWGLQSETVFRNTVRALLNKAGYTVSKGYYGGREVDVVIRNGEHILLEITSSMKKTDIVMYNRSAEEYKEKTGILPRIMVATIYISPTVMREILDSPIPIEIFSTEE